MVKILLDVMFENLQVLLMDRGLTVATVSQGLGVTKQDRDDRKILQHAKENGMIVVTDDKKFIDRLKASDIRVLTIDMADKAKIIHEKVVNKSAGT